MSNIISWMSGWTGGGIYSIFIFLIAAVGLFFVSIKIVRSSEVIISKSKLGAGFIGGVIIAWITSVPELITEITQAVDMKPENGLGDDIGSNLFSTFLIAIAGLVSWRYMFLNKLSKWSKATIAISFVLSLVLTIVLYFGKDVNLKIIGIIPMAFFLFYLLTIYLTYKYDDTEDDHIPIDVKSATLKGSIVSFATWSIVLVFLSFVLNISAGSFQEGAKIGTKSVGGLLLGISTSLPEIFVFVLFLRKRNPTAAISSLVGSHFFNLGIMFFGDLSYTDGPTFNVPAMQDHIPLAALTASLLFVLLTHFSINKIWPKFSKNKVYYYSIPFIMVVGYIVGWVLIFTLTG